MRIPRAFIFIYIKTTTAKWITAKNNENKSIIECLRISLLLHQAPHLEHIKRIYLSSISTPVVWCAGSCRNIHKKIGAHKAPCEEWKKWKFIFRSCLAPALRKPSLGFTYIWGCFHVSAFEAKSLQHGFGVEGAEM